MTLEELAQQPCADLPAAGAVVRWMHCDPIPAARLAACRLWLNAEEIARADRFYFAPDREIFIVAHALTRSLLSCHGGLPPEAWRFVAGPHGRPALDPACGTSGLHFNLSHTTGLVACAVARHEVGVDVESIERRAGSNSIAERFFTPAEVALLNAHPPDQQREAFFQLWTMKEAVMKAMGLGFQLPLDEFAVTLAPLGVTFQPARADNNTGWSFGQQKVGAHHMLAVALRAEPPAVFDIAPVA